MATQTFVLEGKQYTVPKGTSMDELDQYIKGQGSTQSATPAAPKNINEQIQDVAKNKDMRSALQISADQVGAKNYMGAAGTLASAAGGALAGPSLAINPTGALKAVGGSLAGGYLGQEGMKLLHAPEWAQVAGGVAGGLAGGFLGNKIVAPDTVRLPFGFKIPLRNAGIPSTLAVPGPNLEPPPVVIPEPRPTLPMDKPGIAYSLSRPDDLVDAAKAGQPGAGEAMQNVNPGKVLYEPREGTGYSKPKVVIRFPK